MSRGKTGTSAIRGKVEQYQPQVGIVGWAVRSDDAADDAELELELVAGETVLSSAPARVLRPDLRSAMPAHLASEPWVGFRFAPAVLALAASLSPEDRARPLQVRDAASKDVLPGPDLPTGDELAIGLEDLEGTAPPPVSAVPDEPATARELLALLDAFRFDAGALAVTPMAFPASAHKGNIEVVFRVGKGLYIIGGWTNGNVPRQSPALLLLDGRKIAASVFCSTYARPDLRADALAFCAVLRTDAHLWRGDQEFIFTFGEPDRLMRSRRPFKFLDVTPGMAWLMNATKIDAADKELFSQAARARTQGAVAPDLVGGHASLDRVTVFPGFGALVRGWVISPKGDLSTVSVVQGDARADATRERVITMPRPDLSTGFPPLADRTARSGYTAMCVGPLEDGTERPTVELGLDNGIELLVNAGPQITRFGYSVGTLEELALAFPAYASEPFFPELCRAYAEAVRRERPGLHYLRRAPGSTALVFHMPLPGTDARLALTDIARGTDGWEGLAVTLLVGPDHDRAAVTRAVQDVLPDREVGLVHYDTRTTLARTLGQLLQDSGAGRFLFVQRGSRLAAPAWHQARTFLTGAAVDHPLIFTHRPEPGALRAEPAAGAVCWHTADFTRYAAQAVPTLGATMLGRDLLALPEAELVGELMIRYHGPRASPLALQIGADIERLLMQQG